MAEVSLEAVLGTEGKPVNRADREAAGVQARDAVAVAVAADTAPRTVEVPDDLAGALAAVPGARESFDARAHSHRRAWIGSVTEAKRPETRARRIERVVSDVSGRGRDR